MEGCNVLFVTPEKLILEYLLPVLLSTFKKGNKQPQSDYK